VNFFLAAPVYKLSLKSFSPFMPFSNLENSMEISYIPENKKEISNDFLARFWQF